ncbi:alpha/beta hydrolase fold domain-containing protein [Nocardia sp. ET3-3]|uniref:Alpha/beta hydrolase fold domain-containing protein n=1 Tax=Nocardia terrae TaxID=2675851 RepID=A0A7K1V821_9NOCA|nr:alpha/beta hydrolase [Nocardia terrae]MVU82804.1 alpha/beta hydrolase fold domain-containing protein [Nocardia terrae]
MGSGLLRRDPHIDRYPALRARMFQAMFPIVERLRYSSPHVQFATKPIGKPTTMTVPTRHGPVRTLVYAPVGADVAATRAEGRKPPVHLIIHGGAFVIRRPAQEDNVARFLCSELGCYVVLPDYDTAPSVRFPVSEEQCSDVLAWLRDNAADLGWDRDRISLGGASAGGKLALSVALDAIDRGAFVPIAISIEYGAANLSLPDSERTSPKRNPVVGPSLMNLIRTTYFKDVDTTLPTASPALHPRRGELPPTLIITADQDTVRHEMNHLAADLRERGVAVTHHEFPGVDHGFTHAEPVEQCRAALEMIRDHLGSAYQAPLTRSTVETRSDSSR